MKKEWIAAHLLGVTGFMILSAQASAEPQEYRLVIRNHRFEPSELKVPAGQKVKLVIENSDPSAEEFESHPLNREKVIAGKSTGIVFVGPLKEGSYPFFGEFHQETAKGVLIAERK